MDESSRIWDYVLNCKALGELIVWVSDIAQALEMSPALVAEMLEAGGVEVVLDTQRRKCFYSSQVGQDFGHPGEQAMNPEPHYGVAWYCARLPSIAARLGKPQPLGQWFLLMVQAGALILRIIADRPDDVEGILVVDGSRHIVATPRGECEASLQYEDYWGLVKGFEAIFGIALDYEVLRRVGLSLVRHWEKGEGRVALAGGVKRSRGQEEGKPARVELRGKMVRSPDGQFHFANPEEVLRALRATQEDEQEDNGWNL